MSERAGRPAGVQVWNQDCNDRTLVSDYGDPNEPLRPIVLTGAATVFSAARWWSARTRRLRAS